MEVVLRDYFSLQKTKSWVVKDIGIHFSTVRFVYDDAGKIHPTKVPDLFRFT